MNCMIHLCLILILSTHFAFAQTQPIPISQPAFSATSAFDYLKKYVAFGNRYYLAPKREQAIQMIQEDLKKLGIESTLQKFDQLEKTTKITYPLTNIIARLEPKRQHRIILATHWDTRLWAEEDSNPQKQNQPIVGANDGTSGIAVLLEIANLLKQQPLANIGVDLIFFDGEEFGKPGSDDYCAGSRYFAKKLNEFYQYYPLAVIVLDMVGDKELHLPMERSSYTKAKELSQLVWHEAKKLNKSSFVYDQLGPWITDDHSPFQELGIQSILLIDYDYPHWHTQQDTLDRCSPESLKDTGDVLFQSIRTLDLMIK
jgi:glutaminyl-peptide cyclotransferase